MAFDERVSSSLFSSFRLDTDRPSDIAIGIMGEGSAIFAIPAILVACLLAFVVLCVMRVRRLRAEDRDDEHGTAQSPTTTLHQRRASRNARRRGSPERGWPRRSRRDVEHGQAAFMLTPIRTNLAARDSILQPTYIATTRGTPRPERGSVSQGGSSPEALESLPPLPHTPPPAYNEALQESGPVSARQTWL
jgi:hypothetical protein